MSYTICAIRIQHDLPETTAPAHLHLLVVHEGIHVHIADIRMIQIVICQRAVMSSEER